MNETSGANISFPSSTNTILHTKNTTPQGPTKEEKVQNTLELVRTALQQYVQPGEGD